MSFTAPILPLLETLQLASESPSTQLEAATAPCDKSASDEDDPPSGLFVTGGGGGDTGTGRTGGVRWAPGLAT